MHRNVVNEQLEKIITDNNVKTGFSIVIQKVIFDGPMGD